MGWVHRLDQWGSVLYFGVLRLADREKQMTGVYKEDSNAFLLLNHFKEKGDL